MIEQNIEYSVDFNVNEVAENLRVDVGLNNDQFNNYVCGWTLAMDNWVSNTLLYDKPVGTAVMEKASGIAVDGV